MHCSRKVRIGQSEPSENRHGEWEANAAAKIIMVAAVRAVSQRLKAHRAIYERVHRLVEPFGMDGAVGRIGSQAFTATDFNSRGIRKDRARGTWNDGEHRRFV